MAEYVPGTFQSSVILTHQPKLGWNFKKNIQELGKQILDIADGRMAHSRNFPEIWNPLSILKGSVKYLGELPLSPPFNEPVEWRICHWTRTDEVKAFKQNFLCHYNHVSISFQQLSDSILYTGSQADWKLRIIIMKLSKSWILVLFGSSRIQWPDCWKHFQT